MFCAHASPPRDLCQCFRLVANNLAVFQDDSQQLTVLGGRVTYLSCADGQPGHQRRHPTISTFPHRNCTGYQTYDSQLVRIEQATGWVTSKLNGPLVAIKHQGKQGSGRPDIPEGSVGVHERYPDMLGECTELVVRSIEGLLSQPERVKGRERRCCDASTGEFSGEKPLLENCIVRDNHCPV